MINCRMIFLFQKLKPMAWKRLVQIEYTTNYQTVNTDWYDIVRCAPPGSTLGTLTFNLWGLEVWHGNFIKMVKKKLVESWSKEIPIGKIPRQPVIFNINQIKRKESQKLVQVSVITDNWLYFKDQIDILCTTANYKIHGLRRMKEIFHSGKSKINPIQYIYK